MGNYKLLEEFDELAPFRNAIKKASHEVGEWAGVPMPLDGVDLVIDENQPFAEALSSKKQNNNSEYKIKNTFWSTKLRSTIVVIDENGKSVYGVIPQVHGLIHQLHTLDCSAAWGIEQESTALQTLAGLLNHRKFKQYLLTGMFLESSKQSGIMYMFRKLRPTVAMSGSTGEVKILCGMCMHPIAYYEDSWAGAMTPTDDVIAHLMMMRADEPMFWKRCNQHPPHKPESGL